MKWEGKYRLLQASFWMMFCVGQGYITYYLSSFGYRAGEIGTLTAVFGVMAALLQTRAGRIADKGGFFNWRRLILLFSSCTFLIMLVLRFLQVKLLTGLLYGSFLVLINAMVPLVNAGCFYINQRIEAGTEDVKKPVNFGIARGMGSLSYAILSFALGRITAAHGTHPVTVAGMCVSLALLFSACLLKGADDVPEANGTEVAQQGNATDAPQDSKGFIGRYPVFLMMIAGLIPLLTFHNVINTYLLQIVEHAGGNSADMGTAFAIAGVCEVPTMFAITRIKKRISPGALLVVAAVCYIGRGVLMVMAGNVMMIWATEVLQLVTFALYASAAVYYAEDMVMAQDRSTAQALVGGVSTVGQVVGNLFGGLILQAYGVINLLWAGVVFLCAGCVVIILAYRKGRSH